MPNFKVSTIEFSGNTTFDIWFRHPWVFEYTLYFYAVFPYILFGGITINTRPLYPLLL